MRYRFPKGFHRKFRKRIGHIVAVPGSRQELFHGAPRCDKNTAVFLLPHLEGYPLVFFLKANPRQHVIGPEVGGAHVAQHSAVGRTAVPAAVAHAVDAKLAIPGGTHDNFPTGTHAEGINAPAFRCVIGHLVIRRRQSMLRSVLSPVDDLLGMLHSNADGQGLLFHGQPLLMNHLEGIPGTVADCQNDSVGLNPFRLTVAVRHHSPFQPAILQPERFQFLFKADIAAPFLNFLSDVHDHLPQNIGSDMRAMLVQNSRIRSRCHKHLQHIPNVTAFDSAGQLSIRKCACSTFAKNHIGFRLKHSVPAEPLHIFHSIAHGPAPFDDQRSVPLPSQL